MAKKKVTAMIKLQVPAGKATPAPPVGPRFGPSRCQRAAVRSTVQRQDEEPGTRTHYSRRYFGVCRSKFYL